MASGLGASNQLKEGIRGALVTSFAEVTLIPSQKQAALGTLCPVIEALGR